MTTSWAAIVDARKDITRNVGGHLLLPSNKTQANESAAAAGVIVGSRCKVFSRTPYVILARQEASEADGDSRVPFVAKRRRRSS